MCPCKINYIPFLIVVSSMFEIYLMGREVEKLNV